MTISAVILGLSACATGLQKVDYPAGTDPQAKIAELQERLDLDHAKQDDLLSPSNFKMAERFLSEAQDRLDGDESSESVLEDAGYAATRIRIVEENSRRNASDLAAVLSARQAAINANAEQMESEDFTSADKDLYEIGRDIEAGDFHPDEKEIWKLEFKYFDVQLNSMRAEGKDKLSASR